MSRHTFGWDWRDAQIMGGAREELAISFGTVVDTLKSIGKLGVSIGFFAILGALSFTFGFKVLALMSFFYIAAIVMRIPDTGTEALFVESIGTFGLLLCLVDGPGIAAFYIFTATWLSRFTSPLGGAEDIGDTIGMSVAFTITIFFVPWLTGVVGHDLFWLMIYYNVLRFVLYYSLLKFVEPATWWQYWLSAPLVIFTVFIQSYIILALVSGPVFGYTGITGWTLGAFRLFG